MLKIPNEIKYDEDGIMYINENDIEDFPLVLGANNINDLANLKCFFYSIKSTNDYIVKYSMFYLKEKEVKKMLSKFNLVKDKLLNIDFPIGYYMENNEMKGLIIPYYENALSLRDICKTHSLDELRKYYNHSNDNIYNLYLLCLDILNLIEKMYLNGIYYSDIHMGNFIFSNNEVKLIDFDNRRINFYDKKNSKQIIGILENYKIFINELEIEFNIKEKFNDIKNDIMRIEGKVI